MNRHRHGCRRARAFTLIEVLIAIAAFAIILSTIGGVFYTGLRLRNKAAAATEKSLPLQQALAVIKRDLAGIVPPGTNLFGQLQSTPTASSLQNGQQNPALNMGSASTQISPDFYTLTGYLDDSTPWPQLQKVSYRLAESENRNAGKNLIRAVTRNLLPVLTEDTPAEQLLLSGVSDVMFFYFDGTEWIDTWDSTTAQPSLPHAIKVQLQLAADESGQTFPPVELVVPVMVEASTNSSSSSQQ